MITQKLLDDIKSHEEFFFSLFRLDHPSSKTKTDAKKKKENNVASGLPLRPDQVDKIVKQAVNRLKVKQDLVKKRSAVLTKEADKAKQRARPNVGGKRKAKDGDDDDDDDDDAAKVVIQRKKKHVDKKDKKERRKVDLKGRSAKKDAKNKAAKGGGETDAKPEVGTPDVAVVNEKAAGEQFIFGKIETASDGKKKQMGKDFKKHLKNLQEAKGKIAQAKSEDKAKGEALEEEFAWKNVMEKAQGVKVKDDETLIKKSIKRKEEIKKQSKKKWEQREKEVEAKKTAKQQKRVANIRAKKDEKIKKKVKKMSKKGRLVPGLNAPDA